MEERRDIVYIGIDHIHTHPENPRKDLGDLTELAESMKKQGCLQNLTVVPVEGQPGEYYALIGNRRHGASKLAGLEELPCRIAEGLSRKEQLSIMLEENMQRNDLTIWEQAQGFQLMLDLGETEDTIAEKTGFSKKTIKHRLNIAKLDSKTLQEKERQDGYQLTLTDLYELEKIKDIKTRDKILKDSTDSRDLARRAINAQREQKRQENMKLYVAAMKKLGLKKAPKEEINEFYSNKWERMQEYSLDKEPPKEMKFKDNGEQIFYLERYGNICVIRKAKKEKKVLSPAEEAKKQNMRNKKQIKAILKEAANTRKVFIEGILSGRIEKVTDEKQVEADLFEQILDVSWLELSKYQNGDMLSRFNQDIETVGSNAVSWLPAVVIAFYHFLATFLVLFYYDKVMAGIALGSAPFVVLMSQFMMKKQRDCQKKVREMSSRMMTFEAETFYNMDMIKSLGISLHCSTCLKKLQEQYKKITLDFYHKTAHNQNKGSFVGGWNGNSVYCIWVLSVPLMDTCDHLWHDDFIFAAEKQPVWGISESRVDHSVFSEQFGFCTSPPGTDRASQRNT